mmetsp:Transcript_33844/g.82040  ORF Transcript_33844/g.82040 Transcript_33844/m.82040 type:complete len:201 (+) Transcript_33844:317-919(+)
MILTNLPRESTTKVPTPSLMLKSPLPLDSQLLSIKERQSLERILKELTLLELPMLPTKLEKLQSDSNTVPLIFNRVTSTARLELLEKLEILMDALPQVVTSTLKEPTIFTPTIPTPTTTMDVLLLDSPLKRETRCATTVQDALTLITCISTATTVPKTMPTNGLLLLWMELPPTSTMVMLISPSTLSLAVKKPSRRELCF